MCTEDVCGLSVLSRVSWGISLKYLLVGEDKKNKLHIILQDLLLFTCKNTSVENKTNMCNTVKQQHFGTGMKVLPSGTYYTLQ